MAADPDDAPEEPDEIEVAPDTGGNGPDEDWGQVADPEEYNQQARLRAINQARQRVEETIEQSMVRQRTDSDFTEADRRQVVRATVYTYLSNIYWLMVRAEAEELVFTEDFGEVTVEPPPQLQEVVNQQDRGYPRVLEGDTIEPQSFAIRGIKGYMEAPPVFEASWTLRIERRHSEPERVTETAEAHMPVNISQNVFHAANGFASRAGIDIELDSGDPHGAI